jgi:autotransporter-associated beta strand protein
MNRPMYLLPIVAILLPSGTMHATAQTLVSWNGGNVPATWDATNTNWNTAVTDPWNSTNGSNYRAYFTSNNSAITVDNGGVYAWDVTVGNATTPTIEGGPITFRNNSGLNGTYSVAGEGNTNPTINAKLISDHDVFIRVASNMTIGGAESNAIGNVKVEGVYGFASTLNLAKTTGTALTGDLTIFSRGTFMMVTLQQAGNIPVSSVVRFAGTAGFPDLNLNGFATTVAGLSSTTGNAQIRAAYLTATTGTTTLTIDNSSDHSFAGLLANTWGATGVFALAKSGSGTQTLTTTANTYTGGTTINQGTLQIGNSSSLGTGPVVVNANGTLRLNPGVAATNTITGTGTIIVNGSGSSAGNVGAGVAGFGGTIRVDTTAFWTGITGSAGDYGSSTAKWVVDRGATASTFAIYPNLASGTVRLGELSGNGALAGSNLAGTTVFEIGGLGTNSTYSGALRNSTLGGAGATSRIMKVGAGSLTLSDTSTYTGSTSVDAGTLAVNGSIATSSGVSVASGATLAGSGVVAAVSGAGRIAPGNSAGILTAPSIDPASGMGFAFEFGATGSPNYTNAAASVNDVLHLTGGTPLGSALTSSNVMDVYFNVTALGSGDTFRGGAYLDADVDFLAQVQDATYNYYVLGDGNGTNSGYYTLSQFDPSLSISLSTVNDPAAFSGGSQSGRVMEFQAVPEPATITLLAGGVLAAGALARRRAGNRAGLISSGS